MAINNPKPTTHVPLDNVKQNTVQWDAEAYRVFLVDSEGNNNFIIDSNEGDNLRTSNIIQEQLLTDILKELKITNLHLSMLTDNTIDKEET